MIDRAKIGKIIESLELVEKRPKMYLGVDDDPEVLKAYLYGIRHGVQIVADVDPHLMISKWHDAIHAHGYRVTARSPDREMEAKRMTPAEIISELVRIEQTLYKSLLDRDS